MNYIEVYMKLHNDFYISNLNYLNLFYDHFVLLWKLITILYSYSFLMYINISTRLVY